MPATRCSTGASASMPKKTAPLCVVIAGPNGSGKTTFAREFLPAHHGIIHFVNADLVASGLSPLRPQLAARAAGRLVLAELHRLARERRDFAFETTLSGLGYARFLRALKAKGYRLEIVYLQIESLQLARRRIAARVKQGRWNAGSRAVGETSSFSTVRWLIAGRCLTTQTQHRSSSTKIHESKTSLQNRSQSFEPRDPRRPAKSRQASKAHGQSFRHSGVCYARWEDRRGKVLKNQRRSSLSNA